MEHGSSQGAAPPRAVEANGGFPQPPTAEPVRVVACLHDGCGAETRVHLPVALSAGAVRHVFCSSCTQAFDPAEVTEVGVLEPQSAPRAARGVRMPRLALSAPAMPLSVPVLTMPSLPHLALPELRRPDWVRLPDFLYDRLPAPDSRAWRLASVPVAALAVVGALVFIQGSDEPVRRDASFAAPLASELAGGRAGAPATDGAAAAGGAGGSGAAAASLVRESSFSLALPGGWERIAPASGATFAATSPDGGADATLWIQRDPKLDLASFESRSLAQLEALAGSARVVERVAAPTPEASIIKLAADAPSGGPRYEVVLRVAGPYRYYLATTVQPDAPRTALAGVELIQGSFNPEAAGPGSGKAGN